MAGRLVLGQRGWSVLLICYVLNHPVLFQHVKVNGFQDLRCEYLTWPCLVCRGLKWLRGTAAPALQLHLQGACPQVRPAVLVAQQPSCSALTDVLSTGTWK